MTQAGLGQPNHLGADVYSAIVRRVGQILLEQAQGEADATDDDWHGLFDAANESVMAELTDEEE